MQKIVVIGTGGTGTMLLPQMCRYLNSIAEHAPYGKCITIALIDGDTVEKKNLDRQVFIEDDIGANKALVFAGALAENFSRLRFEGYDRYIDTVEITSPASAAPLALNERSASRAVSNPTSPDPVTMLLVAIPQNA